MRSNPLRELLLESQRQPKLMRLLKRKRFAGEARLSTDWTLYFLCIRSKVKQGEAKFQGLIATIPRYLRRDDAFPLLRQGSPENTAGDRKMEEKFHDSA